MERIQSTRFSFRRKGSKNKEKEARERDATIDFDYDSLSYLSRSESRQLFQELVSEFSFTVDQLLELAGFSCAVAIAKTYSKESLTKGKGSILVCCGPGKNGGTGLVCARHLKSFGYRPTVFYPGQGYRPTVFYPKPSTGHAVYANLATQCEKADIPSLLYLPSDAQLVADSYSLIVDAIFGVGFEPPMRSDFAAIVQTIGRSKVPVVSVDIPSGWISDDEAQSDDAVQLQQPDTLISVMAPARCARQFTGRSHLLIGRYLPTDLTKKYDLCLPEFFGTDVFIELRPASSEHHQDGSAKSKKDCSSTEDGPGPKGKNGGDED